MKRLHYLPEFPEWEQGMECLADRGTSPDEEASVVRIETFGTDFANLFSTGPAAVS